MAMPSLRRGAASHAEARDPRVSFRPHAAILAPRIDSLHLEKPLEGVQPMRRRFEIPGSWPETVAPGLPQATTLGLRTPDPLARIRGFDRRRKSLARALGPRGRERRISMVDSTPPPRTAFAFLLPFPPEPSRSAPLTRASRAGGAVPNTGGKA